MARWERHNGFTVRFCSIFNGVRDYEVYDPSDGSTQRISFKDGKWRIMCDEAIKQEKLKAIRGFVKARDEEDKRWFKEKGFPLPDALVKNPMLKE